MADAERALVRLTAEKAARALRETNNLGMGELGEGIAEVIRDPDFGMTCLTDLEAAVSAYNKLQITPENEDLLIASAKLKKKIPCLPSPKEVFQDIDENRQGSRWTMNFASALTRLQIKIAKRDLIWYRTMTNSRALAAGGVAHEYEEKVLADVDPEEKKFEIDEVVDVVMEMLLWKYRETRLCSWLCNRPSLEENGGLGWAIGYDHLSKSLRVRAELA